MIGYRTIIFNVLMLILGYAAKMGYIPHAPDAGMVNALLDVALGNLPAIWATGNIWLRFLTKGPVGEKPNA